MKFTLKSDSFISHFLPGLTTLVYLFGLIYKWDVLNILNSVKNKSELIILVGTIFLLASYSCGLILDALRDSIEGLLDKIKNFKINWDYFYQENEEKQKKLSKWYFPWYVFNVNTFLGVSISLVFSIIYNYCYSSISHNKLTYGFLIGLMALIILFIDSRLLRIEIVRHTNDFKVLSELPDFKVYTRLQKSDVHGIGVFAIREIKKGTYIFLENCRVKTIKAKDIPLSEMPAEIAQLYKDFCPYNKDKFSYTCPENFNFMTISWFLNEDKKNPNVGCDKELEFYALKDIQVGEELFVSYDEVDKNA